MIKFKKLIPILFGLILFCVTGFVLAERVTFSESSLSVTEGSTTDSFTIVLDEPVLDSVEVELTSSGSQVTFSSIDPRFSSGIITFGSENWDSEVTITVTAIDDDIGEGSHSDIITFALTGDEFYDGFSVSDIPVTITDNDLNIVVDESVSGEVDTEILIPLSIEGPSGDVPVTLVVTNGTLEMSTTTGLTFTGPETGSTLKFEGSLANVNSALATLTYTRATAGNDTLEISLVEPGEVFFEETGNLYEYISYTGTWQEAEAHAETLTRYGATGYLTTITSENENDFVAARLEDAGWMGASDADSEGDWQWVTGPEAGTSFWSGNNPGSPVGGAYENWSTGEPNDFNTGEDCGQFLSGSSGQWNDLPCTGIDLDGYVAEFGQEGDEVTVEADTLSITTVNVTNVGSCTDWENLPSTANANIYLTASLDCDDYQSIALGSYTFDGQGYTIDIEGTDITLFSTVSGGIIEDLRLTGSIDADGETFFAPLVGTASDEAIVRRVSSTIDITNAGTYNGGLVYTLTGSGTTIEDSFVSGDITSSEGNNYIGGIAGTMKDNALMQRVYYSGTLTSADARIGGLLGLMNGTGDTAESLVKDSFVVGEVNGSSTFSAALIGLVGEEITPSDALENSYYDETRTGLSRCAVANSGNITSESNVCEAVNTSGSPDSGYFDDTTINAPLDEWNFSTVWYKNPGYPLLYETNNPTTFSFSPADDATGVEIDANISIVFNEPVDAETGNINLRKESDDSLVEAFDVTSDISGSGTNTITINPSSNLEYNTTYYIEIDATAFDDLLGNSYAGISQSTDWQFTTGADELPPSVVTFSPADNATGVAVDTGFSITFSEDINEPDIYIEFAFGLYKASDDSAVFELSNASPYLVTSGNTFSLISLLDLDPGTEYYVKIADDYLDDDAGNFYSGIDDSTTWNFTTVGSSGGGTNTVLLNYMRSLATQTNTKNEENNNSNTNSGNSSTVGGSAEEVQEEESVNEEVNEDEELDPKEILEPEFRFKDVSEDYWGDEYIHTLHKKEVVEGYEDDMFGPENNTTRGELAKIVVKLFDIPLEENTDISFPDVGSGSWYEPYVVTLAGLGVVEGYEDGNFYPDNFVTRAEALKILVLASGLDYATTYKAVFTDLSEEWYKEYLNFAVENDIVFGYEDGSFAPNKFVTRAEMAKMAWLMNDFIKGE